MSNTKIPQGHLIGYARVSAADQNLDRQIDALTEAGCIKVFTDKASGKHAARPGLDACLAYLRPGDTLVVLELSRLGRSTKHLVTVVDELHERGIQFRSLHEGIDTNTSTGELVFGIFAALAQFQRKLIVEGTHEGLAAARSRGKTGGRPRALTPEQVADARLLLAAGQTKTAVAAKFGVSRWTLNRALDEAE